MFLLLIIYVFLVEFEAEIEIYGPNSPKDMDHNLDVTFITTLLSY